MNRSISLWVPFEKGGIDVEKRMVYGRAQVEDAAPDLQGDIVDWGGTKRAFERWFTGIFKGNVREMHRKDEAVGRALMIKPIEGSKEMLVGVRVSKGAESTWQKVLDGTLSGFSIGGYATRVANVYDSKLGRNVRKVLDYVLTELSLVDVPANPRCKIIGIQKNHVAPGLTGTKGRVMENPALEAILEMAKTVGPDAEVIIMKRSDMKVEDKEVDGKIVKSISLDPDAEVSEILKGADLQSVSEAVANAGGAGDIGESLVAFAKGLADLAKSAGYDPSDVFAAATEEEEQISAIGKGLSADDIEDRVNQAVGSAVGPLAKAIDAINEKLTGTQLAVRKGVDGTEAVVTRETPGGADRADKLQKSYTEAVSKREAILAKMDAGEQLTSAERTEAHLLGDKIDRYEVELASLGVKV